MTKVQKKAIETMKALMELIEEENKTVCDCAEPEKKQKAENKPTKTQEKKVKEVELEETEDTDVDYNSMKSTDLYKLCCERGISSKCKKRDKASLIAVLKANDDGGADEPEETEDDEWDEEPEVEKDPYEGKTAKQLYDMCKDRGIAAKPKQKADAYVKLLKEADAQDEEPEEDEDDDDEWEI